jgi:hypothetical protein
VANDSEDKDHNFTNRSESLNDIKRYFGIEDPDDHHQFEKYLKKHTAGEYKLKKD